MPGDADGSEQEVLERAEALRGYTEALHTICDVTVDLEARAVEAFLADHGVLARPTNWGLLPYSLDWPDAPVFLIPLLERDRGLAPEWDEALADDYAKIAT